MWDFLTQKVFFFIAVLPVMMINEGYSRIKKFMEAHGYTFDWPHATLAILIIILFMLILAGHR
jgi:hypothetical protein